MDRIVKTLNIPQIKIEIEMMTERFVDSLFDKANMSQGNVLVHAMKSPVALTEIRPSEQLDKDYEVLIRNPVRRSKKTSKKDGTSKEIGQRTQ